MNEKIIFIYFFFYQVVKLNLQTNSSKQNRAKIKQKKYTIKPVNARHSAHHNQTLIMGTVLTVKNYRLK